MYFRLYADLPGHSALGFGTAPGRWNKKGVGVIYAANTISLTFLELVCINGPTTLETDWFLATLEIKDEKHISRLDANNLPSDWNIRPHPASTRDFGTKRLNDRKEVGVIVPSARLPISSYPTEHNIFLNPNHPGFHDVVALKAEEKVTFQLNDWTKALREATGE